MEANGMGIELIDRIRERAYQLWEAEGCVHGRDREYWLRAESQIASEQIFKKIQEYPHQTVPVCPVRAADSSTVSAKKLRNQSKDRITPASDADIVTQAPVFRSHSRSRSRKT